ncbi:ATP-binding protein [Egicoccus sp. AB-alg6-2]|uniref:GAF domain-containing sensor histidine kinase n=1 Tax=Egicoccus sp. AB-alg6-2 TaxID=3242692 RepID=UPI00359D2F2F
MKSSSGVAPVGEEQRLAAVRRYDILDTPPDGAFDRVTALAARVCQVPISTITIVDEDRIWFKSALGLDGVSQIDREPGLCASAIMQQTPYLVSDAAIDPRTLDNPLVCGELGLRFYAAVPLRTGDGHNLGTLNVIDCEPRDLPDEQLAMLEDLAAIVMDELELRLSAKRDVELESLRAAAAFRDTVVAGISHEMRTPLAVLNGLVDLFGADSQDGAADELREVFRRQVRYLNHQVEQFLDYTHLEHGELPGLQIEPSPLAPVVEEAADLHRDRGRVEVEVVDDPPPVLIDARQTLHVLSELVSNAVRFGPSDEPVRIRITGDSDEGTVRVEVADRGPGIPAQALPHLFERYYRSPDSTGTGLGLFVANALADAQGARIEAASTPGDGSRFTLVLPAADGDRR